MNSHHRTLPSALHTSEPSPGVPAGGWLERTIQRIRGAGHRFMPIAIPPGLIAMILAGGGLFAPLDRAGNAPAENRNPLSVSTIQSQASPGYEVSREFVGRIEARRESRLSMELGGLLTVVFVDEGDRVQIGDRIAGLDTRVLRSRREVVAAQLAASQSRLEEMVAGPRTEAIEAARADVQRWQAQSKLADITLKRNQRLVSSSAVSRQELDEANYGKESVDAALRAAAARLLELENGTRHEQVAAQRADVEQLAAELKTIDINLEKSILYAPYAGVIAERSIDEGTVIDAGTPIVQLLETGAWEARVGLSGEVLPAVVPGSRHSLTINGKTQSAVVRAIRPDRSQTTRTVDVLLTLDSSFRQIHAGDLATLQINQHIEQDGFWVPISALIENYRGLWAVLVASPIPTSDMQPATHELQMRELEVVYQTAEQAYVRGSLSEGEAIVSVGTQRLVPGQLVRAKSIGAVPTRLAVNELGPH